MKQLAMAWIVALLCTACPSTPNSAEALFGSECVMHVDPAGDGGFTILQEHDLGLSPTGTRMKLDIVPWGAAFELGGAVLEPGVKYQVLLFDPFTASKRVAVRNTSSGEVKDVEYESATSDPELKYGAATVVPESTTAGTWLHIHIGAKGEHGVRVLVSDA